MFGHHEDIRAGFEAMVGSTSPLMCRMSGSGSALFAVYRNPTDRDDRPGDYPGPKHGKAHPVQYGPDPFRLGAKPGTLPTLLCPVV